MFNPRLLLFSYLANILYKETLVTSTLSGRLQVDQESSSQSTNLKDLVTSQVNSFGETLSSIPSRFATRMTLLI